MEKTMFMGKGIANFECSYLMNCRSIQIFINEVIINLLPSKVNHNDAFLKQDFMKFRNNSRNI